MLRVASNALIVPPWECAWLSLQDYQLDGGCCLQFECKGENDVTIILKPFPGAKRWQHLQRQQGPAGGEQFAVEANYTVILGSHRNSKLKIEKNGEEKAVATGLPGCTVSPTGFTACWINYSSGSIAVGTGPVGSNLSFVWHDPQSPIPDIQHIGLSCWDKHVSYRNVQLLPPLPPPELQVLELQAAQQQAAQQQAQANHHPLAEAHHHQHASIAPDRLCKHPEQHQLQQLPGRVPALLQLVQDAIVLHLQPADVCHVLQLSEALLPRTQHLYEAAVQLAGEYFTLLVQQHLQELAMLPLDVLLDVLHEPLLDVSELSVFKAVAAWCQAGSINPSGAGARGESQGQQQQRQQSPLQHGSARQGQQQQQQQQQQQVQQAVPQLQGPSAVSQACISQQQVSAAATSGDSLAQPPAVDQHGSLEAEPTPTSQQHQPPPPQQQQQQQERQQVQVFACGRAIEEVLELMRLVRFALMSEPEQQAVLGHPFTQACPVVQQCYQEDLQRLHDYHNRHPSPSSEGGFRCQQRRLVLPASRANSTTDPAALAPPAQDTQTALGQALSGMQASGDDEVQAGRDEALQRLGSSGSRTLSGRLCRAGSSSSSGTAMSGGGWRSYRRRLAPSCKELMYVCDGDRNGVIHYIGTECGTKPWVNPVLSKALDIKASSPSSRYTDPKAIVSGQFLNTSFAGPRYVREPAVQPVAAGAEGASGSSSSSSSSSRRTPSTWWQLDLGPQHRLLCNYYVIRHDGSNEGFVRSWALQASNDLQHWFDLRRHIDDNSIRLPGQYGSWPVSGPAACMPFRAFRLVLLGPTQSQTSPWDFCLSYWECYGYFYKLRNAGGGGSSSNADSMAQQRLNSSGAST